MFLSVNGERRLCVYTHTLQTPLGEQCLADVSAAPCSLCSRHPQCGWGEGVLLQPANSCARLRRACCPSNCCVVRRRVPPKALSDSSKSLASNSDVDPLSANNSPPALGIASRRGLVLVCVQTRRLALSLGRSTCLGRGARGQAGGT